MATRKSVCGRIDHSGGVAAAATLAITNGQPARLGIPTSD